jgi:hypothetical protein
MGADQVTKVIILAEAVVEITTAEEALWTLVQIISSEAAEMMLTNSMHLANITVATIEVAVEVVAVAVATTKATETAMRSTRSKTTKLTLARLKHSVHRTRVKPLCQSVLEAVVETAAAWAWAATVATAEAVVDMMELLSSPRKTISMAATTLYSPIRTTCSRPMITEM